MRLDRTCADCLQWWDADRSGTYAAEALFGAFSARRSREYTSYPAVSGCSKFPDWDSRAVGQGVVYRLARKEAISPKLAYCRSAGFNGRRSPTAMSMISWRE